MNRLQAHAEMRPMRITRESITANKSVRMLNNNLVLWHEGYMLLSSLSWTGYIHTSHVASFPRLYHSDRLIVRVAGISREAQN